MNEKVRLITINDNEEWYWSCLNIIIKENKQCVLFNTNHSSSGWTHGYTFIDEDFIYNAIYGMLEYEYTQATIQDDKDFELHHITSLVDFENQTEEDFMREFNNYESVSLTKLLVTLQGLTENDSKPKIKDGLKKLIDLLKEEGV